MHWCPVGPWLASGITSLSFARGHRNSVRNFDFRTSCKEGLKVGEELCL